jgi:hypothetical protein
VNKKEVTDIDLLQSLNSSESTRESEIKWVIRVIRVIKDVFLQFVCHAIL